MFINCTVGKNILGGKGIRDCLSATFLGWKTSAFHPSCYIFLGYWCPRAGRVHRAVAILSELLCSCLVLPTSPSKYKTRVYNVTSPI